MTRYAQRTRVVCPVYQCGYEYWATSDYIYCPKCKTSLKDIELYGTNDRDEIERLRRERMNRR